MGAGMGEDEFICGESIDHDERVTFKDADGEQWICDRCGAEWWQDEENTKEQTK
jgi:uncharacterized Zn ribbon protein